MTDSLRLELGPCPLPEALRAAASGTHDWDLAEHQAACPHCAAALATPQAEDAPVPRLAGLRPLLPDLQPLRTEPQLHEARPGAIFTLAQPPGVAATRPIRRVLVLWVEDEDAVVTPVTDRDPPLPNRLAAALSEPPFEIPVAFDVACAVRVPLGVLAVYVGDVRHEVLRAVAMEVRGEDADARIEYAMLARTPAAISDIAHLARSAATARFHDEVRRSEAAFVAGLLAAGEAVRARAPQRTRTMLDWIRLLLPFGPEPAVASGGSVRWPVTTFHVGARSFELRDGFTDLHAGRSTFRLVQLAGPRYPVATLQLHWTASDGKAGSIALRPGDIGSIQHAGDPRNLTLHGELLL